MKLPYVRRLIPVWLASLAVLMAACQPVIPAASTEAPSPDLATYTDAGGLFTVQHPAGWVVDATSFPDMPMPYVALGSNQEILDASTAWQPLPEDQIGVAVMLVPRALFAEAGITDDMPLEEALPLIVMAMSADDPQAPEDAFASTAEALTLANGLPAIRMEGEATTEAYLMTAADLGDGLLLIAPRIQAVGVHNEALEAQVDAVINSFELTASAGDVMGHVMDNLAQMEAQAVAGDMAGAPAPTVAFTATDFAFEGPAEIQGGLTRIELTNAGEQEHGLWLVRLDEGKTLEDFLGVMAEIDGATEIPDWFAFYGGVTAEPGATVAYTVDLAQGAYAYFSFSGMETDEPDVARGMMDMLTVGAAPEVAAVAPEADLHAQLVDYSFVLDGVVTPGRKIVQVSNTGMEPHEMVLLRLAEGVEMEAALEALMGAEAAETGATPDGEPPAVFAGGAAPMAAGLTAWYEMEFAEGDYGLICFIPSTSNEGAPHFMLGMVQQFRVAAD